MLMPMEAEEAVPVNGTATLARCCALCNNKASRTSGCSSHCAEDRDAVSGAARAARVKEEELEAGAAVAMLIVATCGRASAASAATSGIAGIATSVASRGLPMSVAAAPTLGVEEVVQPAVAAAGQTLEVWERLEVSEVAKAANSRAAGLPLAHCGQADGLNRLQRSGGSPQPSVAGSALQRCRGQILVALRRRQLRKAAVPLVPMETGLSSHGLASQSPISLRWRSSVCRMRRQSAVERSPPSRRRHIVPRLRQVRRLTTNSPRRRWMKMASPPSRARGLRRRPMNGRGMAWP